MSHTPIKLSASRVQHSSKWGKLRAGQHRKEMFYFLTFLGEVIVTSRSHGTCSLTWSVPLGGCWLNSLAGTIWSSFQCVGIFLFRSPISLCRKQKDSHTASLAAGMRQAVKDLITHTPARTIRACVRDVNEQDSTLLRTAKDSIWHAMAIVTGHVVFRLDPLAFLEMLPTS